MSEERERYTKQSLNGFILPQMAVINVRVRGSGAACVSRGTCSWRHRRAHRLPNCASANASAGDRLRNAADALDSLTKFTARVSGSARSLQPFLTSATHDAQPVVHAASAFTSRKLSALVTNLSAFSQRYGPLRALDASTDTLAQQLHSIDPTEALKLAIACILLANLGPPAFHSLARSARGYAGDLRPTQAADWMVESKGTVLVDIRPLALRRKGVVRLGPSASSRVYSVPRDSVRSKLFSSLSSELVAIKVAALKVITSVKAALRKTSTSVLSSVFSDGKHSVSSLQDVSKTTHVILLDQGFGEAKKVARALTRQGFRRVFVVSGGFGKWQDTPALATEPAPQAERVSEQSPGSSLPLPPGRK